MLHVSRSTLHTGHLNALNWTSKRGEGKGHAHYKPPPCFMHILMSFPGAGDTVCLRSGLIKAEKASGRFPLASWQLLQKSLLHPCPRGVGGKLTCCQGGTIPNCAATNRNRLELWPCNRSAYDCRSPYSERCTSRTLV